MDCNLVYGNSMSASPSQLHSPATGRLGRKTKWYVEEWFEYRRENRAWDTLLMAKNTRHESSTEISTFITCVGCESQSRAKTPNATQLGKHLLRCQQVPWDVKTWLLGEQSLLKRDRKRSGGQSSVFGVHLTPTKMRRSSSSLTCKASSSLPKGSIADSQSLGDRMIE